MNTWTVKKILDWSAEYFSKHSIKTPRLDAEVLLAHTLHASRLSLYLDIDKPLYPEELEKYKKAITRRAAREPVAYVTGKKEFWSLEFMVNRDVLIPRPETEIVVKTAIDYLKNNVCNQKITILDMGTGCGNIVISLAKEFPEVKFTAIDISHKAIDIAIENAKIHMVRDRINFLCGNLFEPFKREKRFALVVSNPPYIPSEEISRLEPELQYEPGEALDGKAEGLQYIRNMIKNFKEFTTEKGCLIMETGHQQADSIRKMVRKYHANADVSIVKDYSGNDRVVKIIQG